MLRTSLDQDPRRRSIKAAPHPRTPPSRLGSITWAISRRITGRDTGSLSHHCTLALVIDVVRSLGISCRRFLCSENRGEPP
ncbi:hypothetical protein AFLA_008120 [Aspergillus flavus NRRL3357]|nr:hypothetical protein AFLA_008120 [Aspergillus flavus NRRL3357]